VLNLHDYNQKISIDKNSEEINEEVKAANIPISHEESVKLTPEPEVEEIEQKSNRDKDSIKVKQDYPKIQENLEEGKNMVKNSNQIGNHQDVNLNPTHQPNLINLETPQPEPEKKEIQPVQPPQNPYHNWNPQQQDTQRLVEASNQLRAQSQSKSVQERNYIEHKQLPTNMLQNLIQSNQNVRTQMQSANLIPRSAASVMGITPAQAQYYARSASASPGIPVMNQMRPMQYSMGKMSYPVENTPNAVLQNTMPHGYNFGMRVQPGYAPQSPYGMQPSRMSQVSGTLPGINQLNTMLSTQQQMNAQSVNQQNQQNQNGYLNQTQLKNFMMNSQGRPVQSQIPRMEYQYATMARANPAMNRNWNPNNPNNPYGHRPN